MPNPTGGGNAGWPSGQGQGGKKIFDIARPGATIASANSRPVLAGAVRPKVQEDISGISAPKQDQKQDRGPLRATNPDDSHKQLMSSKARIVVQPAGMLNQVERSVAGATPTGVKLATTHPDPELLPASTDTDTAAPQRPRQSLGSVAEKQSNQQPAWVTAAHDAPGAENGLPLSALPDKMVTAQHKRGPRWGWLTILILAGVVALVVVACAVLIAMQLIKN